MRMRKIFQALALELIFATAGFAQVIPGVASNLHSGATLPTGAAQNSVFILTGATPVIYICNNNPCTVSGDWVTSSAGTTIPFNQVTAGSNLNVLTMGSDGSLSPVNIGQVAASQVWVAAGLASFSGSSSANSGSLTQNHSWQEQYTFVSALGQTPPSPIATIGTLSSCGTGCSITMTKPTIPTGYSGYSVFACDLNGSGSCTSPVNVPGCTNITTNCVITAEVLSGTAPPTTNTAIVQPANVQATNGPPGWIPSIFAPRLDGNNYPCVGINTTDINSGVTGGILQQTCQEFFSDFTIPDAEYGQYIPYKNSAWVFDHAAGTNTNFAGNQDRAVSILLENPAGDTASRYGVEGLQEETVINGDPTWTGSPDGNIVGIQGQLTTNTTAFNETGAGFAAAVSGSVFNNANCANCYLLGTGNRLEAFHGAMTNNNTFSAPSGTEWDVYDATWGTGIGTGTNLSAAGYRCKMPTTATKFAFNICWYIPNSAMTIGANDAALRNEWNTSPGLSWQFDGPIYPTSIINPVQEAMPVNASLNVTGSITTSQIASSWTSGYSWACSGGSSVYAYQLVAVDNNGGRSPSAQILTSNVCTNPLTSGSPVTLNPGAIPATTVFAQAVRIDVERISGPMSTGIIGSLNCNFNLPIYRCNAFTDTGLSATGSVTSSNYTGGIFSGGPMQPGTTTVSGLPSAASASGQLFRVSDSTTVASEGQNCVGSSGNVALAFSNGSTWKCF